MNSINSTQAQSRVTQTSDSTTKQKEAAINGDFMAMFVQMLAEQQGGGNVEDLLSGLQQQGGEDSSSTDAMAMAAALLGGGSNSWLAQSGTDALNANSNLNTLLSGVGGAEVPSSEEVLNQLQKLYGNSIPQNEVISDTQVLPQANAQAAQTTVGQEVIEETQNDTLAKSQTGNLRPSDFVPSTGELERIRREGTSLRTVVSTGQAPQYISDAPIRIVNESTTQEDDMQAFYNGSMGFQSAVAQARRIISGSESDETSEYAMNEEATAPMTFAEGVMQAQQAQARANAGNAVERVSIDDLASRLEQEVAATRLGDEKRISFKLSPEGLGEVAVRMTRSKEGQILVSIVTASESTAKLLNEQMSQLRNNLHATQAESVNVTVTQQDNYDAMQQFDQQNQSQAMQDQSRQQSQHRSSDDARTNQDSDYLVATPVLENEAVYM